MKDNRLLTFGVRLRLGILDQNNVKENLYEIIDQIYAELYLIED